MKVAIHGEHPVMHNGGSKTARTDSGVSVARA